MGEARKFDWTRRVHCIYGSTCGIWQLMLVGIWTPGCPQLGFDELKAEKIVLRSNEVRPAQRDAYDDVCKAL